MAVVINSAVRYVSNWQNNDPHTGTMDIPSGTTLVVCIGRGPQMGAGNAGEVQSVSINGTTMTQEWTEGITGSWATRIWYLNNPTTGTNIGYTIDKAAAVTSSTDYIFCFFTGASSTTPLGDIGVSSGNSPSGSLFAITRNVTANTSNDLTVTLMSSVSTGGSTLATTAGYQTQIWYDNGTGDMSRQYLLGHRAGTGALTHSGDFDPDAAGRDWKIVGFRVNADSGTTSTKTASGSAVLKKSNQTRTAAASATLVVPGSTVSRIGYAAGSTPSTTTVNLNTVGANFVIAQCLVATTGTPDTTATCGGQAMSVLTTQSFYTGQYKLRVFVLANPPSGASTAVTLGGSMTTEGLIASSYSNVAQIRGPNIVATVTSDNVLISASTVSSPTVASGNTDRVVGCLGVVASPNSWS